MSDYDSIGIDNPYEEGDLRHDAWELRNLPYKDQLYEIAKRNGCKRETLDSLEVLLDDIMSANMLMSNQTPPNKSVVSWLGVSKSFNQLEYTKLSIRGCIERFMCGTHPTDRSKDIIYQMVADILNHTENETLTRTVGSEREGVVNRIAHSKTTSELRQIDEERRDTEKMKRGGPL
jgi:hypothetical protein